jgi:hypothetical protein
LPGRFLVAGVEQEIISGANEWNLALGFAWMERQTIRHLLKLEGIKPNFFKIGF